MYIFSGRIEMLIQRMDVQNRVSQIAGVDLQLGTVVCDCVLCANPRWLGWRRWGGMEGQKGGGYMYT